MRAALPMLLVAIALVALLAGCPPKQAPPEPTGAVPGGPTADQTVAQPETPAPDAGETETPTDLEGELVVGVPCGVAVAYQEIRDILKEANPNLKFVEHVKNVGPMVREILDGKSKVDVFLSLGDKEVARLTKEGKVDGEPTPFLKQAMILIVQLGNPLGIEKIEDLAESSVKTVAVCDPKLSIGFYGQKTLETAGVWDELVAAKKIVRPDQPVKAKNLVIGKQADAAFAYGACADESWQDKAEDLSLTGKADVVMTVPEDLYGGMNAVAVVIKGAKNAETARKFVKFMTSAAAQEAVEKCGYGAVNKPAADEPASEDEAAEEECTPAPSGG